MNDIQTMGMAGEQGLTGFFGQLGNIIKDIMVIFSVLYVFSYTQWYIVILILLCIGVNLFASIQKTYTTVSIRQEAGPSHVKSRYCNKLLRGYEYGKEFRIFNMPDFIISKFDACMDEYLSVRDRFRNKSCFAVMISSIASAVFQDYKIFALRIDENIALGKEIEESVLQESMRKSGINEKVNALEKKSASVIGGFFDDGDMLLSGGESQKIAMSRSFYRNTDVFLLDEPTSALVVLSEVGHTIDVMVARKTLSIRYEYAEFSEISHLRMKANRAGSSLPVSAEATIELFVNIFKTLGCATVFTMLNPLILVVVVVFTIINYYFSRRLQS